jgi:hypothetical protein
MYFLRHIISFGLWRSIKKDIWLYLIWVFLLVFLVPKGLFSEPGYGLDPSWVLGLNLAAHEGLLWGKELVFTYGPLGHFITQFGDFQPQTPQILFFAFRIGLAAFFMFYLLSRFKDTAWLLFLGGALLLLGDFLFWSDSISTYFLFAFSLFYHFKHKASLMLWSATLLGVVSFYAKANTGIICLFFLFVYAGLLINCRRITLRKGIGFMALVLLLAYLVGLTLNVDFAGYFLNSLQIVQGYNESMVIPVSDLYAPLFAALVVFSFFLVLTLPWLAQRPTLIEFSMTLFLGFSFFMIFKQSFVRADGHVQVFFYATPFFYLLALLFIPNTKAQDWLRLGFPVFLLFSMHALALQPGGYVERALGKKVFRPSLIQASIPKKIRTLPASVIQHIGERGVDVVGSEISLVYYNGLRYRPRPVFQSYSAYTETLANLNQTAYESHLGPGVVLFHFGSIDRRHPFWDEPLLLKTLSTHFQESYTIHLDTSKGPNWTNLGPILLFERRETPLESKEIQVLDTTVSLNSTFEMPAHEGVLFAQIEIEPTFAGQLRKTFFQAALPTIELQYSDGQTGVFDLVVPIAKLGVPVSPRLESPQEGIGFFRHNSGLVKTVQLRIGGNARYFKPKARIRFFKVEVEQRGQ